MKRKLPEVDPVVLHDIAGMRAGKAIFIGLIIIILLLFFLLFMLPGIVRGGRYVSFSSSLSEVGVVVDGKYIGSTEGTVYFISSGEHTVNYIKNGNVIKSDTIKISHPIFFTLLIHYRESVNVTIEPDEEIFSSSYRNTLDEAVHYSAVTDYDSQYNYKPIFTFFAKDAAAMQVSDISSEMKTLIAFVTSAEMKSDLDNALSVLEENNISFRSDEFNKLYDMLDDILSVNSTSSISISNPVITVNNIDNTWYSYSETEFTIGKNGSISVNDAPSLPVKITVPSFTVNGHMVTEYDYALFVQSNPYWAKSNREQLITDNVVDEYYLEGIYLTTATRSERPVRNISWYAAKAFTAWLTENDDSYSYSLPTEAEFEVIAKSTENKSYSTSLITVDNDRSTPSSVMGGLWEFTDSHFVPLARLADNYEELSTLDEADIIIKGGSYMNDPDNITAASTGVIAKDTCSEYAGFRIVRNLK